jgi:hypothetical protein
MDGQKIAHVKSYLRTASFLGSANVIRWWVAIERLVQADAGCGGIDIYKDIACMSCHSVLNHDL